LNPNSTVGSSPSRLQDSSPSRLMALVCHRPLNPNPTFGLSPSRLQDSSPSRHGLSTEQFPVSAYVGSSKNLNDLKDPSRLQDSSPSRFWHTKLLPSRHTGNPQVVSRRTRPTVGPNDLSRTSLRSNLTSSPLKGHTPSYQPSYTTQNPGTTPSIFRSLRFF